MTPARTLFLSGAEMHPTRIRREVPGARFIARARINPGSLPVSGTFRTAIDGDLWGILVETTGEFPAGATPTTATTDLGRQVDAVIVGDLVPGDPVEAVAAARYWELAPAYVARLMAAARVPEEAPRDDAQIPG